MHSLSLLMILYWVNGFSRDNAMMDDGKRNNKTILPQNVCRRGEPPTIVILPLLVCMAVCGIDNMAYRKYIKFVRFSSLFFFDKFLIINQLVLNLMLQIFFPHFFIIIFSVVIRLINISEIDLFWNRIIFAIIRMEIRIIIFIIEFCWQHMPTPFS